MVALPDANESRPQADLRTAQSFRGDSSSLNHLDGFTAGILADAFRDGQRRFWLKRAQDFEDAKPRVEDFHGRATREELNARWLWLHGVAQACRAKAEMVGFEDEVEKMLDDMGRAS